MNAEANPTSDLPPSLQGSYGAASQPPISAPPRWLSEGQLRWAYLGWEPLMMIRRTGGSLEHAANAHWTEDWFRRIRSESYIEKLRDAGFNCVTTHFHKGFGMEAEAEEMEVTRRVIELCHKHGIRVFTYIQSISIMPETILDEIPDAESWLQLDENGRHRAYDTSYWRVFPCPSHEDYRAYVLRVAERAVNWAGTDGLHLDNTNFFACQCDACCRNFREYLKVRHPAPDQTRFGIPRLDRVRIPTQGEFRDPVYQEAIRYRCETLIDFVYQIRGHARALNPEVAVSANFGAPCPYNWVNVLGVDYAKANRSVDIAIAENGNFPRIDEGVPVTQLFAYKAAHATGSTVMASHWNLRKGDVVICDPPERVDSVKLDLAESAAFCRGCVSATWATRPTDLGRSTVMERDDILAAVRLFNRFFQEHESLYVGSVSLANVATYRNFPSSAFAFDETTACVSGYEQAFVQNQVPFEVVFGDDLDDLERYDVLVLANVLCMSEEEMEHIRAFVRAGKGLVATGRTSLFDEHYRQRKDYGLADLFGIHYEPCRPSPGVQRNGRVLFVPETLEKVEFNKMNYETRAFLPPRHAELVDFVREVSPSSIPVEVQATPFVAVEICRLPAGIAVHLVNYDNRNPVKDVEVVVSDRFPGGSDAELLSVDGGGQSTVLPVATDEAGRRAVRVPDLETYSVVVFPG